MKTLHTAICLALLLVCSSSFPFLSEPVKEWIPRCELTRHDVTRLLQDSIIPIMARNGTPSDKDLLWVRFGNNSGKRSDAYGHYMRACIFINGRPFVEDAVWKLSDHNVAVTELGGVKVYVSDFTEGNFTRVLKGKKQPFVHASNLIIDDNEVTMTYLLSDSSLLHTVTLNHAGLPDIDNFSLDGVGD